MGRRARNSSATSSGLVAIVVVAKRIIAVRLIRAHELEDHLAGDLVGSRAAFGDDQFTSFRNRLIAAAESFTSQSPGRHVCNAVTSSAGSVSDARSSAGEQH